MIIRRRDRGTLRTRDYQEPLQEIDLGFGLLVKVLLIFDDLGMCVLLREWFVLWDT